MSKLTVFPGNTMTKDTQPKFFIIHVPSLVTDLEIDDMIRGTLPIVRSQGEGFVCAIYGHDNDKRELYQIPEVTVLCQRLVKRGFISILNVSTLLEKEDKPWLGSGFGALEIWAIAKGLFSESGDLDIDHDTFGRFWKDLDESNKIAEKLEHTTSDGMHRTVSI